MQAEAIGQETSQRVPEMLTAPLCDQERLRDAEQLAQEMAVQASAIEAARGNVEHHYAYICTHFQDFMHGCAPRHFRVPALCCQLALLKLLFAHA